MIDISLRLAGIDEKPAMWAMLQDYLTELSQYGAFDQSYPHFASYWQEDGRKPYWIELRGKPVDWVLAELFVAPEYRAAGVATIALQQAFKLNRGWWEGCVFNANGPSLALTRGVLTGSSCSSQQEIAIPGKTIFRFKTT